jgi:hypothetical protein
MLTTEQRTELETRERSRRGRADASRRARVILLLADGDSYEHVTFSFRLAKNPIHQ